MPHKREMRLVNKITGEFICKFCQSRHFATTVSQNHRSFWVCRNPDCLPARLRKARLEESANGQTEI